LHPLWPPGRARGKDDVAKAVVAFVDGSAVREACDGFAADGRGPTKAVAAAVAVAVAETVAFATVAAPAAEIRDGRHDDAEVQQGGHELRRGIVSDYGEARARGRQHVGNAPSGKPRGDGHEHVPGPHDSQRTEHQGWTLVDEQGACMRRRWLAVRLRRCRHRSQGGDETTLEELGGAKQLGVGEGAARVVERGGVGVPGGGAVDEGGDVRGGVHGARHTVQKMA
jgi:hypothetical protein